VEPVPEEDGTSGPAPGLKHSEIIWLSDPLRCIRESELSNSGLRANMFRTCLVLCLLVLARAFPAVAALPNGFQEQLVLDGLNQPMDFSFLPDGRMLVTERPGRLRIVTADGKTMSEPVAFEL